MSSTSAARRMVGAALGLLADRAFGEPPDAVHPVAAFGRTMGFVEASTYRDARDRGVLYALSGAGLGLASGALVESTTVSVGMSAAGRMLRAEARAIARLLETGDLPGARAALPALVGRDPSALDRSGVAAAVVESVAENTVDAVVGPALWGAAAGAPGALGYRAVNTMDAMVGHRSARYEQFGWASARLDDAAGFLPARATALLVALVRPARAGAIRRAVLRDAPAHPSPNAGVAEAAFAGALGCELGGPLRYGDRAENRPLHGRGPRPEPPDIARAVHLADDVELALAGVLVVGGLLAARRNRRSR